LTKSKGSTFTKILLELKTITNDPTDEEIIGHVYKYFSNYLDSSTPPNLEKLIQGDFLFFKKDKIDEKKKKDKIDNWREFVEDFMKNEQWAPLAKLTQMKTNKKRARSDDDGQTEPTPTTTTTTTTTSSSSSRLTILKLNNFGEFKDYF